MSETGIETLFEYHEAKGPEDHPLFKLALFGICLAALFVIYAF